MSAIVVKVLLAALVSQLLHPSKTMLTNSHPDQPLCSLQALRTGRFALPRPRCCRQRGSHFVLVGVWRRLASRAASLKCNQRALLRPPRRVNRSLPPVAFPPALPLPGPSSSQADEVVHRILHCEGRAASSAQTVLLYSFAVFAQVLIIMADSMKYTVDGFE